MVPMIPRERVTFLREKGVEGRDPHWDKRIDAPKPVVHGWDSNGLPIIEPDGQSVSPKTPQPQN